MIILALIDDYNVGQYFFIFNIANTFNRFECVVMFKCIITLLLESKILELL